MSTLDELLRGGGAAEQSSGIGLGERMGRGLAYAMAVGNGSVGGLLSADEFFRRQDADRAAIVSSLPFKQTLAAMIDQGLPPEQALAQTIKLFPMAEGFSPNYRTVQPQALPDGLAGPPQQQRLPVLPPSAPGELIQATDEQTKLDAYGAPGAYGAAARMAGAKVPISSEVAQALQDETLKRLRSSESFTTYEMGVQVDGKGNVLLDAKERKQPLFPEGFTQRVAGFERFREVPSVYPGVVTIEPDPAYETRTTAAAGVLGKAEGMVTPITGGKTPGEIEAEQSQRMEGIKAGATSLAARDKLERQVRDDLAFNSAITSGLEPYINDKALPAKDYFQPEAGGVVAELANRATQYLRSFAPNTYPDAAKLEQQGEGLLGQIARRYAGENGVLTEKDVERIRAIIPNRYDTQAMARDKLARINAQVEEVAKRRLDANWTPDSRRVGANLKPIGGETAPSPLRQKLLQKYGG